MATTHGYLFLKRPDHPLAPPSGQIPAHRVALYDLIGPGPHPCHWCSTPVDWSSHVTAKGALVVDHLDGNGKNNAPDNLVPSCHPCNTKRGHDYRFADKPVIVLENGYRRSAAERTCEVCQKPFLVRQSAVNQGKGKTCSRTCANTLASRSAGAHIRAESNLAGPRAAELHAQGMIYKDIAAALDAEGLKPPRSDKWSVASVYNLVQRHR